MPINRNPTVRQRRLGRILRTLRVDAGLTLVQAADTLGCAESKVSRAETAQSGIRRGDLLLLLDRYGVHDAALRTRLEELSRDGRKRGWWHNYGSALKPTYADYIALEADAAEAFSVQTFLIPGLLQTEDYTRAVVGSQLPDATTADVDVLTQVRQERKAALARPTPLTMWIILAESVLHHEIGGPSVMREQLHALTESAQQPNIRVQVLPQRSDIHASLFGPFVVLTFPDAMETDVVYVDSLLSTLYIEEPDEVAKYNALFRRITAEALPYDTSLDVIARAAKELGS